MNEKKHNGWTNYETWAVALWINNEQGSQEYWRDQAKETMHVALTRKLETWELKFATKDIASTDLEERLKSEHEENCPKVEGVYSDLLNASLSEVNWHEIAKSILEDIK